MTATANEGTFVADKHTFTANGSFDFVATDAAGNVTTKPVTITNIDKTAPVITIGDYNTAATNVDIIVTATANEGTFVADKHTFTANGSFEFVVTDAAGNVTLKKVTITNIDKTAPVITAKTAAKANVKSGASVKTSYVIVTIIEKNKGTNTVTLKGKKVTYPSSGKFTAKGSYVITSKDKAGNVEIFKFTIK